MTYLIWPVVKFSIGDIEKLGTTPGRFRPTLRKLVDQGYLTIEGKVAENVYPTVAALRWQNPKLSEREAKRIVAKLR